MKNTHLRFHLDSLKPWEATEKMDKCEAVEWAFTQGYGYRKTLEMLHLYRADKINSLKNPFIPKTYLKQLQDEYKVDETIFRKEILGKWEPQKTSEVRPRLFCILCGEAFNSAIEGKYHRCPKSLSQYHEKGHTNEIPARPLLEDLKKDPKLFAEVFFDECKDMPQETWDKIGERISKLGKAARAVVDKIAEDSGVDKNLIYHKCGSLKLSGDNHTCPACLNNPAVEKAFTANEISIKLYDAKFRGLIDGDQLFKLLDYFEEDKNENDN